MSGWKCDEKNDYSCANMTCFDIFSKKVCVIDRERLNGLFEANPDGLKLIQIQEKETKK